MTDDRTRITRASPSHAGAIREGELRVSWRNRGEQHSVAFSQSCLIGRDEACQVRLDVNLVSKRHAELYRSAGGWFVRDLGSSNGTYLNGKPVKFAPLNGPATLVLGDGGPELQLELGTGAGAQPQSPPASRPVSQPASKPTGEKSGNVTQFITRYLKESPDQDTSEEAQVVRHAFQRMQKQKTRRYRGIIAAVALLLVAAIGFGGYQYQRTEKLRSLAVDIFYNMKGLEVQIHALQESIRASGDVEKIAQIKNGREKVREMSRRYDEFVDKIGALGTGVSEEDRLILRMARIFGECELTVPKGFSKEVKKYIKQWQKTGRLHKAVVRADRAGYTPVIREALTSRNLPLQFFYLALQESNFRARAVGPETRFGIAKGMWQFIPTTATEYGLRIGPLATRREYDPKDERFDLEKASEAAAHYLSDIFATEAQASGLLVMASYNWGHNRVRRLIKGMPEDPAKRNFWELLKKHKVPQETYDYVYHIFSAAVIGQDPALFGFDFDQPFKDLTDPSEAG